MKLLIISDIHGSAFFAEKIEKIINAESPDKLVLLGDLYYHGPRNPLPEDYNPMKVSQILNTYKDKIIAIKGNCDAEVDEMISEFKFNENTEVEISNKKIFFTHGHKNNIDMWPATDFDIMIYGHFHMGFIHEEKNKIFANPGSISLPKNNTKNSYMILEDNKITLKDIDGNIIIERVVYI